MTTIAYRDGQIAADSQITAGNTFDVCTTKIARRGPMLAAASGTSALTQRFMDWFKGGMKGSAPDLFLSTDEGYTAWGFVITPEHRIIIFSQAGPYHGRLRNGLYATGSGAELALGAMSAGADAAEAVRIAAQWDTSTGGEIVTLSVPK